MTGFRGLRTSSRAHGAQGAAACHRFRRTAPSADARIHRCRIGSQDLPNFQLRRQGRLRVGHPLQFPEGLRPQAVTPGGWDEALLRQAWRGPWRSESVGDGMQFARGLLDGCGNNTMVEPLRGLCA